MNIYLFNLIYGLAHQSIFLDWLFVFGSNSFGYIMIFLAFVFLFLHTDGVFDYRTPFLQLKNKIKEIIFVFFSAVSAWIIQAVVKSFIISPRPFIFFENVKPLFLHGGMDSFPSGHSMFFAALAMSLYFVHKRIGFMYFIVALIVGLSRVASGVHFPIDILFGYIFGIIIALIFRFIFIKKLHKS
jgi:undecaprenyl-diphosphatase